MTKRKWPEAIKSLTDLIANDHDQCGPSVYEKLATCLRFEREYDQALLILKEGIKKYPENVKLKKEIYELFRTQREWDKAKSVAKKMIELEPEEGRHYFELAYCHSVLEEIEPASECLVMALEKKHNKSIDEIVNIIKNDLSVSSASLNSSYIILGGRNNLGFIKHVENSPSGKEYLTKIVNATKKEKNEIFFTHIVKHIPQLENITPGLVGISKLNDTSFITMEKINGYPPKTNDIQQIAKAVFNNMPRLGGNENVLCSFNLPSQASTLRLRNCIHFFMYVHEESANKRLIDFLGKELSSQPPEFIAILDKLKKLIIDTKLYKSIDPKLHYGLLHGDLGPHNILIEEITGKPYVIDWDGYIIGPAWFDIADLFVRVKLKFKVIERTYLSKPGLGRKLNNIEKIFFIYALIIMWLRRLDVTEDDKEAYLKNNLLPALECLEQLVSKEIKKISIKKIFFRRTNSLRKLKHGLSHFYISRKRMLSNKIFKVSRKIRFYISQ